ncbi:hypothetical protein FN976_18590 [Caenimonas sedimenti]|uniref:7TM-DISM receptor extracellular domain-containing protein n=1 Tax=Caenimonas sedimenti TaxID=2596921 RepID=A0A562ZNE5_9BURK|nr:7TM diverse intracellular signaling domain-containing protein [Caenimonas sedimenti]TWO69825.1 hypothetical protein FN976_18590 [Caenimonas sedimenti]
MKVLPWLAGLWLLVVALAAAAAPPPQIVSVKSWQPPEGGDTFAQARELLDALAPTAVRPGEDAEFRAAARRPTWLAITLPELSRSWVLEFTHPSLRTAELYLADGAGTPVGRSGRDVPASERLHQRFPATLALPPTVGPRTVYVRLQATVPAQGHVLLAPQGQWELQSRLTLAGMTLGFSVAALAALYALVMALVHRSGAYVCYGLLTLAIIAHGLFVTGLGEAVLWPMLAAWRTQCVALSACFASGLALLLLERAFALERSTPRFSRLLRVAGLLCLLTGAALLPLALPVEQAVSLGVMGVAVTLGFIGMVLAWRTHNRAAGWLLAGYLPLLAGVGTVAMALDGQVRFAEWVLMVLPFAGMLQIPFQLHGLRLLEHRRGEVRRHLRKLEEIAGPQEESRDEIGARLAFPRQEGEEKALRATLLLLRFTGLTPGRTVLREHDGSAVEKYLQSMMAAAARPGGQIGRWSFHELVVRDMLHDSDAEIEGFIAALFAEALRSERFGIPSREPDLRIAFVRVTAPQIPVMQLTRKLSRALDDPARRDLRHIEIEAWED